MTTRTSALTGATDQTDKKDTSEAEVTRLLVASLETMGVPFILLEAGVVSYIAPSAESLLELPTPSAHATSTLEGKSWASAWAELCPGHTALTTEPQRIVVQRGDEQLDLLVWQRPVEGTNFSLVGLQEPSNESEHEREMLRVLNDMQEQADDLFALYQITQFLNITNELDLLCSTFLHEL